MSTKPMLITVAVSLAMSASSFAADDLVLARDGKALAPIVVSGQGSVAGFAARELKDYLDRVSGAEFKIVSNADRSPRIFVGDCPAAWAAGLDVETLKRDGFYRVVAGDDLFLLGRDDAGPRNPVLNGHPGIAMRPGERATLFAVYDLLEDVCGVRWFMAGPHGEVVPQRAVLSVPRAVVRDEPAFLDRRLNQFNLHHYHYAKLDADEHAPGKTKDA